MTITAKYNGKCSKCGKAIKAGEKIEWTKQGGASHINCSATSSRVSTASMMAASAPRSNGKATLKQVRYAMSLIDRLGRMGWHDTDMGQFGGPPPTYDEVSNMSSREVSDLIADCKN